MHLLRGLRGDQAIQCLPELRRRLCASADQAFEGVATGRERGQASALGQAREAEIFAGGCRGAFGAGKGCSAAGEVTSSPSFRDGALAPDPESRDSGFALRAPRNDRGYYSTAKIVPSTSPK